MQRLFTALLLSGLVTSSLALASTDHCPSLRGIYTCPGRAGGRNETTIVIQESKNARWMTYYYTWEERGEAPVESVFVASDQGRRQDGDWSMLGKCADGFLFVAPYGEPKAETRLVHLNADGDYEAIRNGDRRSEICKRRR
jgi:hypothetical protein